VRSMKTASIEKRISHIVMDDVRVMSKPSPSASRARGIRPKARVKKLLAMSQRSATTVPRVLLRTRCSAGAS
jgi:hypothetical protein